MSVFPGAETEYERRHRPIWVELQAVLKRHGVHNYSIWLLPETRQLFAYVEIEPRLKRTEGSFSSGVILGGACSKHVPKRLEISEAVFGIGL
jgi:hypothetical protein